MNIMNVDEHLNCFNYNKKKPTIELVKRAKKTTGDLITTCNVIVFVMEGSMKYHFKDCPGHEAQKGRVIFVPVGSRCSYHILADIELLFFRVNNPIALCANFSIDKLYKTEHIKPINEYEPEAKDFGLLEINTRTKYFLEGIVDCISDGLKCECWFEMKIKEFFLLLTAYYSKENIRDFLHPILSKDSAFSEHIRQHWQGFRTVKELAAFMHMSPRQLSARFVSVFGMTPYKWMTEGRANIIRQEITSTNKQFKQIALENGFVSDSHFTRFCKTMFGKSPTQLREEKK